MTIIINEKWIESTQTKFRESVNPITKQKEFILEALIVPFGETSRNGVLYNKESVIRTHKQLIGKTLNHNHKVDEATLYPKGEWINAEIRNDGMWGTAKVYDVNYNEDYIEWLNAASSPRVSLQVTGEAKQKKAENGKYYQEAIVNDWLETSTVNLPGFDKAHGNFQVAIMEALGKGVMDKKKDGICTEESISPGEYKTKGGETITVHSVKDGKAIISGDDSKNKEIDVDALKAIIGKESFFDKLNNIRENIMKEKSASDIAYDKALPEIKKIANKSDKLSDREVDVEVKKLIKKYPGLDEDDAHDYIARNR